MYTILQIVATLLKELLHHQTINVKIMILSRSLARLNVQKPKKNTNKKKSINKHTK